ncbi:tetratricopeptide repeat protein [Thalassotalea sp. LPB0316]|uniref:tetratricopeptide repeat protein n=1 Tax=Thalassotalea sp. LPB0316 TaxID=2769490 RepID=UPI001866A7CB|nr:tetratricopeptide repeat protein [Thalassotalea sp. LPB0316]QOL25972.1 tetratricopeptide repeat protein [Thalassotalea sp. LPB0316]
MKKLLLVGLLITSTSALANQSQIDAIELASMQLNTKQLVALTEQNESYDQGLALYRLAIAQNITADTENAIASLDKAMSVMESHVEQQPNDGEAWALLAQIYGLKVSYEPMKGALYGPKSGHALAKACELAPNSPRTYLVKGVGEYNTPAMFGGSKTAALSSLDKAIKLFSSDSSENQWGEAEAYVWRGLTHLAQNNQQQAINDWQHALEIAPSYGWAKMLIKQNQ